LQLLDFYVKIVIEFCPDDRPLFPQGQPRLKGYDMGTNRIPEANTFALKMARAARPQIPGSFHLCGMWMHMDMQIGDDLHRSANT
jgi:hypothetical protein